MQHYAAFHLGLHCLQKYTFRGFPKYKGLTGAMFLFQAEGRLTVKKVGFDDTSIFSQNCDIFSPCARGKVSFSRHLTLSMLAVTIVVC